MIHLCVALPLREPGRLLPRQYGVLVMPELLHGTGEQAQRRKNLVVVSGFLRKEPSAPERPFRPPRVLEAELSSSQRVQHRALHIAVSSLRRGARRESVGVT